MSSPTHVFFDIFVFLRVHSKNMAGSNPAVSLIIHYVYNIPRLISF